MKSSDSDSGDEVKVWSKLRTNEKFDGSENSFDFANHSRNF